MMISEHNKKLYYRYLKIWVLSLLIFIPIGILVGFLLKDLPTSTVAPVTVAISFLAFPIVAIYGLVQHYALSHKLGYIVRGKWAYLQHTILFVLYIFFMWAIYVRG